MDNIPTLRIGHSVFYQRRRTPQRQQTCQTSRASGWQT